MKGTGGKPYVQSQWPQNYGIRQWKAWPLTGDFFSTSFSSLDEHNPTGIPSESCTAVLFGEFRTVDHTTLSPSLRLYVIKMFRTWLSLFLWPPGGEGKGPLSHQLSFFSLRVTKVLKGSPPLAYVGVGLGGRGGNGGSQPGGEQLLPRQGGDKKICQGEDRGGKKNKIFL